MTDFNNSLNHSLKNNLSLLKKSQTLTQVEIGPIKKPLTIEFYEKWLSNNYHGNMAYLQSHLSFKRDPLLLDAKLKSVISVAQVYFPEIGRAHV